MTQRHITIGSEFFANAFNDYANWQWAIMREFFQNSIDCGSDVITVFIDDVDGKTHLEVRNDGGPMDEETLVEKLFALGGSGKNFDGENTGGFGKAKELLYFCHDSYRILSGFLNVNGSGASYKLIPDPVFLFGTHSKIVIDGNHAEELIKQTNKWIDLAQCKVQFIINGERRACNMKKGSPRRDLGYGQVYTNKSGQYQMVVRINGMPMFTERTNLDRLVIVELAGNSAEVMTSNRDGLINPFCNELSEFVTELAVDKRSALKGRRGPRYTQYRGTKLCHSGALNVADVIANMPERAEYPGDAAHVDTPAVLEVGEAVDGVDVLDSGEEAQLFDGEAYEGDTSGGFRPSPADFGSGGVDIRKMVSTLGTNFILKNETDLKIPAYYDPGSGDLSSYSLKLIRYWGRIMLEMHRQFDKDGEFSIGFIFDEGEVHATEAECEQGDYGLVYYLNPCKIVEQKFSYSKSFRKRFKLTERDRLISIGLHEFVHATGCSWHDEDYANRLTDMMAHVMKNRKRFNWCFK